jgi:hypothetical protein
MTRPSRFAPALAHRYDGVLPSDLRMARQEPA